MNPLVDTGEHLQTLLDHGKAGGCRYVLSWAFTCHYVGYRADFGSHLVHQAEQLKQYLRRIAYWQREDSILERLSHSIEILPLTRFEHHVTADSTGGFGKESCLQVAQRTCIKQLVKYSINRVIKGANKVSESQVIDFTFGVGYKAVLRPVVVRGYLNDLTLLIRMNLFKPRYNSAECSGGSMYRNDVRLLVVVTVPVEPAVLLDKLLGVHVVCRLHLVRHQLEVTGPLTLDHIVFTQLQLVRHPRSFF